jgi:hypothetical protein
MPPRSKVAMLPQAVRDELERRIIQHAFAGYGELANWLQEQGYKIAADSVQRYGVKLQSKINSLELSAQQAKAIALVAPAGRDPIFDATIDLLCERVFSALMEADQVEQGDILRLSHIIANLGRITIARQKWADNLRSRF